MQVFCQIPKVQIAQGAYAHDLQPDQEPSSEEEDEDNEKDTGVRFLVREDEDNDDALMYEDVGAGASAGKKRRRTTDDNNRTSWSKITCRAILTELWGEAKAATEKVSVLSRCENHTLFLLRLCCEVCVVFCLR